MAIDRNDLLHVESGALITLLLLAFLPWWAAASITLAIGVGKELYDKEHGGVASWSDIIYDVLGTLGGMAIYMINLLI